MYYSDHKQGLVDIRKMPSLQGQSGTGTAAWGRVESPPLQDFTDPGLMMDLAVLGCWPLYLSGPLQPKHFHYPVILYLQKHLIIMNGILHMDLSLDY